jgi:hypothetical protein
VKNQGSIFEAHQENFNFVDMGAGHIRLYDLFRKELNLPDDKAAAFVLAVEDVCGVESETRMQFVATKSDLERLENDCRMQFAVAKEDLDQFKTETRTQFAAVREDLDQFKIETRTQFAAVREDMDQFKTETLIQFTAIRGDLDFKFERSNNDIYKAIFLSGIAQFIAMLGAVLAIVKLIK